MAPLSNAALDSLVPSMMGEVAPRQTFEKAEYDARLKKLCAAMEDAEIDTLVLSSPEAICWLHGYDSRWYRTASATEWPPVACTVVRASQERFIAFETQSHEALSVSTSVADDRRFYRDRMTLQETLRFISNELISEGWTDGRFGFEMGAPTPNRIVSEAYEAALAGARKGIDATVMVRGAQRVKSLAEIEKIREAARLADVGLNRLREVLHPEMTELESWGEMMLAMAREGGEPSGLHEVVCGSPAVGGHPRSTTDKIGTGIMYADPCGVKHRYHANTCRSFWLGEPPSAALEIFEIAGDAFDLLKEVARPGVTFGEVGRRIREYYRDAGVWEARWWVGGYQLGIAFPPDWVGDLVFTIDLDEDDKVIEHGLVTNYESNFATGMIETVVYLDEGTETLSSIPPRLLVVDN